MSRSKGIKLPPVNRDVITETFEGGETMENDHLVEVAAPVEPGVYKNVELLDVASMHPASIENLEAFGPYTAKFSELKAARIAIKRGAFDEARRMLDGKLAPFLEDEEQAEALSYALKIVINIVYGLTSAKINNVCIPDKETNE